MNPRGEWTRPRLRWDPVFVRDGTRIFLFFLQFRVPM
jgi:hypothetical protein